MILRHEFYYLRHGQTDHNAKNLLTFEDEDLPLTPAGIDQAQSVQKHICSLPIQTICHSPLIRAKETTQIATKGLSVQHNEIHNLTECKGPIWEAMTTTNSTSTKDVLAFYKQTISGINEALAHPGPVLIIAHGGIHWALCSQLNIQDHIWKIDNCQLVHFRPYRENDWVATLLSK